MPHVKNVNLLDIWRTLNKIRAAIFRVNINLWDYFKPLDPNNNCLISESKFVAVFTGPLKGPIGLSDQEIHELTDYFRVQDGRIFYTQMCSVIDNSCPDFSKNDPLVTGLEWEDPLHVNRLSQTEERRLCVLLTKIATSVKLRDIVLRPYFQDYELIAKNAGVVTFAHFGRILYYLGIKVSDYDYNLLIKRFGKDSYTVNYIAFIAEIDKIVTYFDKHGMLDLGGDVFKQFPGKIIDAELPKLPRPEIGRVHVGSVFIGQAIFHPILNKDRVQRELVELMRRIQKHVLANRIRVCEFFEGFDPLHSGRITIGQFKRGLDSIGISSLHRLYLTPNEIETVIMQYRDPNDETRVCWDTFESDVNLVFNAKEMEKYPELLLDAPPQDVVEIPKEGASNWQNIDNNTRDLCEEAVRKCRVAAQARGLCLKAPFNNYDQQNTGHVSRPQYRQCLQFLGILLSKDELSAMEQRFLDDMGFNYFWFLQEADPQTIVEPKYDQVLAERTALNEMELKTPPHNREKDIVAVIAKIKAKVVRERIKITEFLKEYDKHHEACIRVENFYRGVNNCRFDLTPTEMETLIEVFKSPRRPCYVDYIRFTQLVEESFAQDCLERAPLITPVQYVPSYDDDRNFLNFDERHMLSVALQKLSKKPDMVMNLLTVFNDFDKENCGTVTENHFVRALSVRGMATMVSNREMEVIFKCFGKSRGLRNEVDYRAFLKAIEILYATDKFNPF